MRDQERVEGKETKRKQTNKRLNEVDRKTESLN